MMKKATYRLLMGIMTAVVMLLTACSEDVTQQSDSASLVQIVGRVPGFADYDVTTRAAKTPEESAIKYMALLIYDNADQLIDKQWIESSVPLFMIDRNVLSSLTTNGINSADMYMITNISEAEIDSWNTSTVSDLLAVTHEYNTASLNIPANGFPMVGKMENVDLSPGYRIPDSKIEIPLENLFAKIVFNIRMELVQNINDPSFQLVSWEVHNLPKGFGLAGTLPDGQTAFYNNAFDNSVTSRRITGTNPITGANSLSFSFYMPEHKVNPAVAGSAYSYPSGIKDNEKQRYKPCLVDKEANSAIAASYDGEPTYVVINGLFTDHQKQQHEVAYKVYLGSDNWQNFQIERNGQYNNSIVICGITNFKDAEEGSVSIDHRVTLEKSEFSVQMERETLLDSHFEVRPLRIDMNSPGRVEVKLSDNYNWIRLEKKTSAPASDATYCTNGKRKYFTTTLMNDLPNNPITITSNSDNCVWVYIDENTEIIQGTVTDAKIKEQQNKTRKAQIEVKFIPQDGSAEVIKTYTFEQRYLYPVKSAKTGNLYYIEYYEEYLHNFDSDDNFGLTDYEGMPWGLDGEQLSHLYKAAYVTSSQGNIWTLILSLFGWDQEDFINNIGSNDESIYYDFYLTRDNPASNEAKTRDFSGYAFTSEIVDYARIDEKKLSLVQTPESAIEYCYNKNKRANDGSVSTMKWYMPSIDEIEDITMSAYTEFNVFQDKYYWSSQPAYINNDLNVTGSIVNASGSYSCDDINRARATKVSYMNGTYDNELSNTNGASGINNGVITNIGSFFNPNYQLTYTYTPYTGNQLKVTRGLGNKFRTDKCRIRAVYKHN